MKTPLYSRSFKAISQVFVFVLPSFSSASGSVEVLKGTDFTAKSIAQ